MEDKAVADIDHRELKAKLFDLMAQFSVVKGQVPLASGLTSDVYIDARQVYFRGEAQFILGELFYQQLLQLECAKGRFDACGGMAMGSIPLSCALTSAAFRRGREFPGFAVRKEAKEHGMRAHIEGNKCLHAGARVLILEDVVTTGSSALKAIHTLRNNNVTVKAMLAIVDREQGGLDNLLAEGIELHSLFQLRDFREAEKCG